MDVPLAEPVPRRCTTPSTRGDTGYAAGTAYARGAGGVRGRAVGLGRRRRRAHRAGARRDARARRGAAAGHRAGRRRRRQLPRSTRRSTASSSTMDRRVVEAPLGPDGRLDLDALDERVRRARAGRRPRTCCATRTTRPARCTPPTSSQPSRRSPSAHGVGWSADEIHAPLVLPGAAFVPVAERRRRRAPASRCTSASKGWNLAGLKAAVRDRRARRRAATWRGCPRRSSHGPSHLGVLAHTAALRRRRRLARRAAGRSGRQPARCSGELLAEHLPSVRWTPPEATYLAWLDCRELGLDDATSAEGRGLVTSSAGPAGLPAPSPGGAQRRAGVRDRRRRARAAQLRDQLADPHRGGAPDGDRRRTGLSGGVTRVAAAARPQTAAPAGGCAQASEEDRDGRDGTPPVGRPPARIRTALLLRTRLLPRPCGTRDRGRGAGTSCRRRGSRVGAGPARPVLAAARLRHRRRPGSPSATPRTWAPVRAWAGTRADRRSRATATGCWCWSRPRRTRSARRRSARRACSGSSRQSRASSSSPYGAGRRSAAPPR